MVIDVKLGSNIMAHIDEKDEMTALHKGIVLGNPRHNCTCGNTDKFVLSSNKTKEGYTYIKNICGKCGKQSTLGQYQSGGYFWKEFEEFKKKETNRPPED